MKRTLVAALLALPALPAFAQQPMRHSHHHDFPPALSRFHDALAPLWHARRDAQWAANACAAAGELDRRAQATAQAAPPQGMSAEEYAAGAGRLAAAVTALAEACAAGAQGEVEARMAEVHRAFHVVSRH